MSDRNGALGRCWADLPNSQIITVPCTFWRRPARFETAPSAEAAPVKRGLFESIGSAVKLSAHSVGEDFHTSNIKQYCTWHEDANQAPVRNNLLPPQTSDISFSSHLLSSNFLLISSHLIILFDLISTQLFSGHLRWFQLFSGPKHVPKPDRRPKPPKKQVIETLEGNFERFKRYLESQKRESSSKTHRRNFGVASPPRSGSSDLQKTIELRVQQQHRAKLMQPTYCEVEATSCKRPCNYVRNSNAEHRGRSHSFAKSKRQIAKEKRLRWKEHAGKPLHRRFHCGADPKRFRPPGHDCFLQSVGFCSSAISRERISCELSFKNDKLKLWKRSFRANMCKHSIKKCKLKMWKRSVSECVPVWVGERVSGWVRKWVGDWAIELVSYHGSFSSKSPLIIKIL